MLLKFSKNKHYDRFKKLEVDNISNEREMFKDYPDVVTIDDLQAMLHIGRNTAYKVLQDDLIKALRIGKKYIIPKTSVINFVSSIS